MLSEDWIYQYFRDLSNDSYVFELEFVLKNVSPNANALQGYNCLIQSSIDSMRISLKGYFKEHKRSSISL